MTTQEQQLIDGLVQRVNGTSLPEKDPDAEQRLKTGLAANPNALYILSQTVLVQQYALDQAKQQINAARAEMDRLRPQPAAAPSPQKHTGFLESIFGGGDHNPPPPQQQAPPPTGYAPVQNYAPAQPGYTSQQASYAPQSGSAAPMGGGFLRGAAQTAAGVAAGALAFEGVESLMHGFGGGGMGGGFGGGGMGGGFGGGAPREEVVNNYYGGDDRGDRNESRGIDDNNSTDANPGDNMFTDANDQSGNDDTSSFNDQDNSSGDDSASFDDSGSFDDNSGGGDNSF